MTSLLARTVHLGALVGSAAIGWWGHEAAAPAAAPAVVIAAPAPQAAKSNPLPEAPLIAVASDGNVTLRVEQQPLEWVLEQIALQSGKSLPAPPPPAAAVAPALPPAAPATHALPVVQAPEPEPADALSPLVDP
jgi:hypothetical protein